MSKIKIGLNKYCEISIPTLDVDSVLELPVEKVKELVSFLEVDEIIDSLTGEEKTTFLVDRLHTHYPGTISCLLSEFFSHKKDIIKCLTIKQQLALSDAFSDWIYEK